MSGKKIKKKENERSNHSITHQKYQVKIPIAYLYVYFKLREALRRHASYSFMQTSEVLEILKLTLKLPRKMKYVVLAEMESYGLLRRINHQKYYISDKKEQLKYLDKIKTYLDEYPFW